jgi:hypothetical protein
MDPFYAIISYYFCVVVANLIFSYKNVFAKTKQHGSFHQHSFLSFDDNSTP